MDAIILDARMAYSTVFGTPISFQNGQITFTEVEPNIKLSVYNSWKSYQVQ